MHIANIRENVDGSALLEVDFSSEELKMFLEYAISKLIEEAVADGRLQCAECNEDVGGEEQDGGQEVWDNDNEGRP